MASEPHTIVLIHGMWMTPLSWEHWAERFREQGHEVIAPAWLGLSDDPAEVRRDPSPLHGLSIPDVVDHYERDHPRARPAADHHRPLVRRAVRAAAARPRARLGGRRARHGRAEGRAQAAALDATRRLACAEEPVRQEQRRAADARAVPLVLHERAQRGGLEGRLRALLHPRLGAAVLPGRVRELQPERHDEGGLQEPGTPAAAARDRRESTGSARRRSTRRTSRSSGRRLRRPSTRSTRAAATTPARTAGRRSPTSSWDGRSSTPASRQKPWPSSRTRGAARGRPEPWSTRS